MGFKHAAVLAPVSFFLGIFFICFNVDHRILWNETTEEVMADSVQFYTTFYSAPPAIKALLHGMMGVGVIGLLIKVHKWDESAMFFDGSSLVAYVFGIAIYLTVTVPALQGIVSTDGSYGWSSEDKLQAMRVLSAGNVITIVLLGAILALQAGQEYASRADARALATLEEEEKRKAAVAGDKKDQ